MKKFLALLLTLVMALSLAACGGSDEESTDKRGVELRDELVRRLGVDRCKVVAWGEGCKDANEYLLKYDLPRLRQQVEQAAEIP